MKQPRWFQQMTTEQRRAFTDVLDKNLPLQKHLFNRELSHPGYRSKHFLADNRTFAEVVAAIVEFDDRVIDTRRFKRVLKRGRDEESDDPLSSNDAEAKSSQDPGEIAEMLPNNSPKRPRTDSPSVAASEDDVDRGPRAPTTLHHCVQIQDAQGHYYIEAESKMDAERIAAKFNSVQDAANVRVLSATPIIFCRASEQATWRWFCEKLK